MNEIENINIVNNKPNDFDIKWSKWIKEVHDIKNKIYLIKEENNDICHIMSFYFDSVKKTSVYSKLYNIKNPKGIVVFFHGYGGNIENTNVINHCMDIVKEGYNVVAIDMLYQGGKTINNNNTCCTEYGPLCVNILDLESSYQKLIYQDCLKIIDIITDKDIFPKLENLDIITYGLSQGGGLALMVAALSSHIKAIISDIPSGCAILERVTNNFGMYNQINKFINDHKEYQKQILFDCGYFDVVNMANNIKCPVLASVGEIDKICPPYYFLKAYQKIMGKKNLICYKGYGHGGFDTIHLPIKIKFLNETIGNN